MVEAERLLTMMKKKKATGRPKLDLAAFERRIRIRPLRIEDFDRLVSLQQACFPGMVPWKRVFH